MWSEDGTGKVKPGLSSLVKTGQDNLDQVELSQERSSQVGIN